MSGCPEPVVSRRCEQLNGLIHRIPIALATVFLVLPSLMNQQLLGDTPRRPNVIVILSDDQGWGDLSLNGNQNLQTPNIDRLAREGASFDRFFVCPVCSPTRAEFLTGRYHPRSGVYSTSAGGERMNLDETTIAQTFKAAGYHTAAYGKWHNGMQAPYHPNSRGFDDYYGFCSGHWGQYYNWMLEHNGELVRGKGFCIDDFTDHALNFIEQHQREPFFVYLPLNTPHSPMQVPDEYWARFENKDLSMRNRDADKEDLGHTRAALAMCENIDFNVGRLLTRLEQLGLQENTIVVYFCDNGPNGVRWNGDMKGRKGSTDEGGVRSPLLIRFPQQISPGLKVSRIAAVIDLLPTLADLAGIPVTSQKPLDGISLRDLLTKQEEPRLERFLFSHWRNRVSVRTQQYRFDHQGKLFDMVADPGQRQDVAKQHPELVELLSKQVDDFRQNVLDGYDQDSRPFIIGHPEAVWTQIPARDGTAHGAIQRSNKFPNCSYFTNWKNTSDEITWDVEVPADGVFEVQLYYTCKPENVGCEMELSFGDQTLTSTISKPNDSPLVGAADDRVQRMESYVKDFQPWPMGELKLSQGHGTLTLKAKQIPGDEAIEFRLLMLKRK